MKLTKLERAELTKRASARTVRAEDARRDLAEARIASRDFAAALEQLLEIVRRDRGYGDDLGRRKMLAVFEMAAGDPDLVSDYRRRLSATLY